MNKLFIKILIISILIFVGVGGLSYETAALNNDPVNLYLFYGEGCPHCAKEKIYLDELKTKYGDSINISQYEIYYDADNAKLFADKVDELGIDVGGVPFLIVGDKYLVGYGSDSDTGLEIKNIIDDCLLSGCNNLFENSNDAKDISSAIEEDDNDALTINTGIFGEVDLKSVSLPITTIIIALVDGFNPCAMWILIFLITMLINMKDKKKLFTLGSIFIITSGLIYFVFLAAWFNFFKFIGYVYWIKVIIGIVAITTGVLHVKTALNSKGGCHATNEKQRESIMNRIKSALSQKSYVLSIIGIMTLAVSVNLIEVVCSAGLPAIYTNLLSTIDLSRYQYYGYLLLYVLVFIIDDLLIFIIAIKTFEVTGIAKKYTKWSNLIGGIIILIIGVILILKPELLMFG